MNMSFGTRIALILALLAMPVILAAEEQARESSKKQGRYVLVDLGTFGGPNSNFQSNAVVVNDKGTAAGNADTSLFDPILGIPVFHAFKWDKGVLTDLGTLPDGALSSGQAINSRGVVAGFSTNGLFDPIGPEYVATLWQSNGGIVDLGTLGGGRSIAFAINDRGQAVGAAADTIPDPGDFGAVALGELSSPTQWHAALWQNGTIQDLGTLGDGPVSFAYFVNERGQVAGVSLTNSVPNATTGIPTVAPFLWENGHMTNLGTFGGVWGRSTGMNNKGQVVGFSNLEGDQNDNAFLWEKGLLQNLGTLGGDYNFSEAWAVNDNGEIAGHSFTPDGAFRGFRWRRGVMTDLGSVPGYDCSNTGSINASGQIAGWAYPCDLNAPSHAVLWDKKGPGIDLNTFVPPGSDLELIEAQFINDLGEIAGLAFLPNGDAHAFLLIPRMGDARDDSASASEATEPDVAPVGRSSTHVTHGKLTPEGLAALRARFANRSLGFKLPKQAN